MPGCAGPGGWGLPSAQRPHPGEPPAPPGRNRSEPLASSPLQDNTAGGRWPSRREGGHRDTHIARPPRWAAGGQDRSSGAHWGQQSLHSRSCRAPSPRSPRESPAPPPATHRPKLPVMGNEETKEPRTLATPEETRRGAGEALLCLCPRHDPLRAGVTQPVLEIPELSLPGVGAACKGRKGKVQVEAGLPRWGSQVVLGPEPQPCPPDQAALTQSQQLLVGVNLVTIL